MRHPSLSLDYNASEHLDPKVSMRPNERCWCQSGLKYKKCHYRREEQEAINPFEIEKEIKKLGLKGFCSHPKASPEECSPHIISAHTVQKRGGLAAIAEEGHVMTTISTLNDMIKHEGRPPPRKKGVKHASTFSGFCNKHDTELFRPIETGLTSLDKGNAFLFSFRAMAFENFRKVRQLEGLVIQRLADKGQPFWKQVTLQRFMHPFEQGVRLGLNDIQNWKMKYDELFISGNLNEFHHCTLRFGDVLPLVMCGAFQVECDFSGRTLQRLGRRALEYEHITINVTATTNGTVASFGFIGSNTGTAAEFLEQIPFR